MLETYEPASSNDRGIAKAEYDSVARRLTIHFKGGGIYDHERVPPDVFLGLQNAASAGEYFHRVIAKRYDYRRRGDGSTDRQEAGEE